MTADRPGVRPILLPGRADPEGLLRLVREALTAPGDAVVTCEIPPGVPVDLATVDVLARLALTGLASVLAPDSGGRGGQPEPLE